MTMLAVVGCTEGYRSAGSSGRGQSHRVRPRCATRQSSLLPIAARYLHLRRADRSTSLLQLALSNVSTSFGERKCRRNMMLKSGVVPSPAAVSCSMTSPCRISVRELVGRSWKKVPERVARARSRGIARRRINGTQHLTLWSCDQPPSRTTTLQT